MENPLIPLLDIFQIFWNSNEQIFLSEVEKHWEIILYMIYTYLYYTFVHVYMLPKHKFKLIT